MKLRRMITMTAAGAIAAGALIGATGAVRASASETTYYPLCVDGGAQGNRCIVAPIQEGAPVGLGSSQDIGGTWLYPNNGQTNYIETSPMGFFICLQVNQSEGYLVLGNTCVGDSAEGWHNEYISSAHRTRFVSEYNSNLCLAADYNAGEVYAEMCANVWWQEWGTS
jgi:hypothetical protein